MNFIASHWMHIAGTFSVLYTICGFLWTIRVERMLRRLAREQKIAAWTYDDMRRDVDDVQAFLENGNTLRQIPVIPLRKQITQ